MTTQKSLQIAVAEKAAPPVVVSQAKSQGLVAPTQVVYLPQVPLDVPLPGPGSSPRPRRTSAPPDDPTGVQCHAECAGVPAGATTLRSRRPRPGGEPRPSCWAGAPAPCGWCW